MRALLPLLSLTVLHAAEMAPAPPAEPIPSTAAEVVPADGPAVQPAPTLSKVEADRLRASKTPLTLDQRFVLAVFDAQEAGKTVPPAVIDYTAILPGMDVAALAERLGQPTRIREDGPQAELRWIAEDPRTPMFIVWLRNDRAVRMRVQDQL